MHLLIIHLLIEKASWQNIDETQTRRYFINKFDNHRNLACRAAVAAAAGSKSSGKSSKRRPGTSPGSKKSKKSRVDQRDESEKDEYLEKKTVEAQRMSTSFPGETSTGI